MLNPIPSVGERFHEVQTGCVLKVTQVACHSLCDFDIDCIRKATNGDSIPVLFSADAWERLQITKIENDP